MNLINPKTFIFIGRSGCGKGTQANLLIEYLKKGPFLSVVKDIKLDWNSKERVDTMDFEIIK